MTIPVLCSTRPLITMKRRTLVRCLRILNSSESIIDPIQGACDLTETNPQDLPEDAGELMQEYAENMPVVLQEWWLRLRNN